MDQLLCNICNTSIDVVCLNDGIDFRYACKACGSIWAEYELKAEEQAEELDDVA